MLVLNRSMKSFCRFANRVVGDNRMLGGTCRGSQLSRLVVLLLALAPIAGCGGLVGTGDAKVDPPAPILDPIAAFAADPPAAAQAQVFLADRNETVTLRIVRRYAAASGRECREVRVSRRGGDNLRLYCRTAAGWIEARPLIAQTAVR